LVPDRRGAGKSECLRRRTTLHEQKSMRRV
jgi:hypothetical protein